MRSLALVFLLACGGETSEPIPAPTPAPPATPTAAPSEAPPLEEPAAEPEDPSASWVELLHALPGTWVSASDAYQNDPRQVGRLVDGDLETAWNGFSGSANASLFVRAPQTATIRAVELTVGYTRVQRGRDLFTGNRRIRRVKLSSEGFVQEAALDPESRELQRIVLDQPVKQDLEIYVLDSMPGTESEWRELCVSELRVLGDATDAQPDSRQPMVFVGHLPPVDPVASALRLLNGVLADQSSDSRSSVGRPMRFFSGVLGDDAQTLREHVPAGACYSVIGEADRRRPWEADAYPPSVEARFAGEVYENTADVSIVIGEICAEESGSLEIVIEPAGLISYWMQVFETSELDAERVDDETGSGRVDDGTSDFVLEREGLHLTEMTLGPQVESREVVDPRATFSKANDDRVYCLARLENPDREATTLYMGWERDDRPADRDDSSEWGRTMSIPAQPRYVTFGYRGTGQRAGRHRCVIRDEDGVVLGRVNYDLTE